MSMIATVFVLNIVMTRTTHVSSVERIVHEEKNSMPVVDTSRVRYGLPVRLMIAKIGVDATIQPMGLTKAGDMESPKTNEHTGWYKYGARPGNEGSAVIAGHLGLNGDAVFRKLSLLEKGDTVSVADDRGQTASFVVTDTRRYSYDDAPSEVFTSADGVHLNLITCDGDWNAGQNTYADRLVVFTERQ